MSDDLVKRLRDEDTNHIFANLRMGEAANHIEELEAKLAKAVEALKSVINCSNDVHIVHYAETTLAELKGQNDE